MTPVIRGSRPRYPQFDTPVRANKRPPDPMMILITLSIVPTFLFILASFSFLSGVITMVLV
jgi:hypothetical protein